MAKVCRRSRCRARVGELVRLLGADDAGKVGAVHLCDGLCAGDELIGVGRLGADDATHDAVVAQVANDGAGVDVGEDGNVVLLEILVGHLGGAPVGRDGRELAGDEALDIRAFAFIVGRRGAVVADLGVGQDDDLPGVGGVGEDLLIAGEGGVEDDFAGRLCRRAEALTAKDAPVFERQNCLHCLSNRSGFNRF